MKKEVKIYCDDNVVRLEDKINDFISERNGFIDVKYSIVCCPNQIVYSAMIIYEV